MLVNFHFHFFGKTTNFPPGHSCYYSGELALKAAQSIVVLYKLCQICRYQQRTTAICLHVRKEGAWVVGSSAKQVRWVLTQAEYPSAECLAVKISALVLGLWLLLGFFHWFSSFWGELGEFLISVLPISRCNFISVSCFGWAFPRKTAEKWFKIKQNTMNETLHQSLWLWSGYHLISISCMRKAIRLLDKEF